MYEYTQHGGVTTRTKAYARVQVGPHRNTGVRTLTNRYIRVHIAMHTNKSVRTPTQLYSRVNTVTPVHKPEHTRIYRYICRNKHGYESERRRMRKCTPVRKGTDTHAYTAVQTRTHR